MKTVVIKISGRYWCGFGKGDRLITAWCLAGAVLFLDFKSNADFQKVKEKLNKKGVAFSVRTVEIVGG